ncbi:MAG: hypothetical protein CBC60_06850 [Betaproteobacteria bacterium TMED100]|nr:MAG: hypothetical protein CBC60_06850 [Betaproteobacteria bacterium TMED100]
MKIRDPHLSSDSLEKDRQSISLPPLETATVSSSKNPYLFWFVWTAALSIISLLGYVIGRFLGAYGNESLNTLYQILSMETFWYGVMIGFFAQIIDGALGMAYGISATTFLLSLGTSPAVASASVHIAAVFTTGLSGIAHVKFGNVSKSLFMRLLLPGIIGAFFGVLFVTKLDGELIKPLVSFYLLVMGALIIKKSLFKKQQAKIKGSKISKLALAGGFMDSAGGGGWGPIVTSTLVGAGQDPRSTIGSVNFAEFFLTLATAGFFSIFIASAPWPIIFGLVVGGLFAAPFAAFLCKYLPVKFLMIVVGFVVSILSLINIFQFFK